MAFRTWLGVLVGVLSAPSVACAQPASGGPTEGDAPDGAWTPGEGVPTWRVRFEPSLGFFSLSGDFEFPSGGAMTGTALSLEDVNTDSPRLTGMGELHFARGPNRITLEVTGVSTSNGSRLEEDAVIGPATLSAGERLSFSLEYETASLIGSHRVLSRASTTRADGVADAAIGLDVVAGVRFHRVDADAAGVTPGSAARSSVNELFAEPVIGTRVELLISDWFSAEGRVEGGAMSFGDRTSASGNLAVSFTWRPDPRIGVQAGYRLLVLSLESGDDGDQFEWSGAMAGLFWGVSISF